jgi:hypothetical protein
MSSGQHNGVHPQSAAVPNTCATVAALQVEAAAGVEAGVGAAQEPAAAVVTATAVETQAAVGSCHQELTPASRLHLERSSRREPSHLPRRGTQVGSHSLLVIHYV